MKDKAKGSSGKGKGDSKGKDAKANPKAGEGGSKEKMNQQWKARQVVEHGNVFVNNLPHGMTEMALKELFEGYGDIMSVKLIEDKSYGFVQYTCQEQANLAVSELHEFMPVPGRKLSVQLALNDKGMGVPNRKIAEGRLVVGGDAPIVAGNSVFVFYIPETWEEAKLYQHFKHCGDVAKATIMRETNGASKGYGFVSFWEQSGAVKAIIGMNGFHTAEGRILKVGPKKGEENLFPSLPIYPSAGDIQVIVPMQESPPGATAYVFHLPHKWDEGELHRRFIHFGNISNITIMRNGPSSRGFGFVGFDSVESAKRAVDGFDGFDTGEGKFLKVQLKKGDGTDALPLSAQDSYDDELATIDPQLALPAPEPTPPPRHVPRKVPPPGRAAIGQASAKAAPSAAPSVRSAPYDPRG